MNGRERKSTECCAKERAYGRAYTRLSLISIEPPVLYRARPILARRLQEKKMGSRRQT